MIDLAMIDFMLGEIIQGGKSNPQRHICGSYVCAGTQFSGIGISGLKKRSERFQ
jgi:hypothetical protein